MRSTSASQAVQPLPSPHRPRFVCPSLTGWHKRCPNSASFFTCARPIVAKAGSTSQRPQDQQRLRPVFTFLLSFIYHRYCPTGIYSYRNLSIIGARISSRLACRCICALPRRAARVAGPVEKRKHHLRPLSPSPPYGPRALTDHKGAWA